LANLKNSHFKVKHFVLYIINEQDGKDAYLICLIVVFTLHKAWTKENKTSNGL
jgi:hypothetical protein